MKGSKKMKTTTHYEIIINGVTQVVYFAQFADLVNCVNKLYQDGKLKDTDEIKFRKTIVVEENWTCKSFVVQNRG